MIVHTVSARFAIAAHATELPDGASSGETCRENAKQRPHTHRRPGESQDPLPQMIVVVRRWNDESHSQFLLRSMGPGFRQDDS